MEENKPTSFVEEAEKNFHEGLARDNEEWLKSTHANYVSVKPNSHFYDNLNQIINSLKINETILITRLNNLPKVKDHHKEKIDYIIKGLENSIEMGYKIVNPKTQTYGKLGQSRESNSEVGLLYTKGTGDVSGVHGEEIPQQP